MFVESSVVAKWRQPKVGKTNRQPGRRHVLKSTSWNRMNTRYRRVQFRTSLGAIYKRSICLHKTQG